MRLDHVLTGTGDVLRAVKPDQLDLPTPCHEWTVRALVNHLLQVCHALAVAGRDQPIPGDVWERDLVPADGGWSARFDEEAGSAVAGWSEPSAMGRTVHLGEMAMPAPVAVPMFTSDLLIHGWDLAVATGQEYRVDGEAVRDAYRFVLDFAEQGRAMGIFGEPVAVPDDAPELHRTLGLSGRDPHWMPA